MGNQKLALLALGGRTTLFYIREVNQRYQKKIAKDAVCPMLVKKTDFSTINQFLPDQFSALEEIAKSQLDSLASVTKVIVPNITLHQAIDRLCEREDCNYPLAHPLKALITKLAADNCAEIKLVSSQYGMNSDYLRSAFAIAGIRATLPSEEDQVKIDEFRKKVYSFSEINSDVDEYLALLERYQQDSKVVIACTELSLSLPSVGSNIYDMARVQIDDAMTLYDE